MATNNRDVKLTLNVGVNGTEDVAGLAGSLDDVATAGTSAAPGVEKLGAELATLAAKTKELRQAEAAAKAEVIAQKTARDEQRDALAKLRAESDRAARSTQEFQAQERALKLAIIDGSAAIRAKQSALEQAATSARVAAAAEQRLTEQIRAGAAQQAAAHATVGKSLESLGAQLRTIQQLAGAAVGGQLLGGLAGDVAKTADAYANLAARIKLVTGEGQGFTTAFNGVFEVATRTNTAVEQTGTLFARIAEAGKLIGVSTAEALHLTESINQAVQISGASADSSNAAVTQLIQGLQSGVLRGDEFNSVMEQAPRLAKALADGLGVTTGELRKLAEAGSLTAQAVIGSLQGQSAALQKEFATLPPTVGRAIQSLSNEWVRYVGEVDKAHGVSAAAAAAISGLAKHLDTLGSLLYSAGKAAAAYQALNLAQTFLGIGTAARTATAEVVALNAAQTTAGATGATAAAGAGRLAAALAGFKVFALVAVVTNLREIGTAIGETIAKWNGAGKAVAALEAQLKAEEAATRASAAAKAELAQKIQMASDKALGLTEVSRKVIAEFDDLIKKGASTSEALDKVAKSFEIKDISGIQNAGAALDALAIKGKISAAEIQAAYDAALKGIDLGTFTTNARAAFDASEQGARRLQAVLDASLREAIRRTGLDFEVISGGMGKASRSAINDTDALIAGLDRLKAQGVDTGQALTASIGKGINTADSQKAIEAVRAQVEALRGVLGDKIADGLLDQAIRKANELKDAIDKATPGINSLREAYAQLGLKTSEELARIASTNKTAWEEIRRDGTASADTLKAAFSAYAASALAATGAVGSSQRAVTEAMLKTDGAIKGLTVSFDENGKMIVRTQAEAAAALSRTNDKWREQREAVDDVTTALERQKAAMERSKKLEGQNAVDATLMFKLKKKLAEGTLTAADLADIKNVTESLDQNREINNFAQANGMMSAAGVVDDTTWAGVNAGLKSAMQALMQGGGGLNGFAGGDTSAPPTTSSTPAGVPPGQPSAPARAATHVTINLASGVDVSSRASVEKLARAIMPAIDGLQRKGLSSR